MNDPQREADRWFRQAENDLSFAKRGYEGGFYSHVCFLCQQSGEKAVKAVHYKLGKRVVTGHSVHELAKKLVGEVSEAKHLIEAGSILDQYYIPTRYPNGLPEGAPFEMYTQKQAEQALGHAETILDFARRHIANT